MSILTVEKVNHGFGARTILEDATFKLLNGEHVGLVGANGEGKSTFLNIITGELMPDEGKVSWCNRVTIGYLDQSSSLTQGKTIRDVLREAFQSMFDLEAEMLELYDEMARCDEKKMAQMLEDVGDISHILESSGFYTIDAKIEEVANGLGLGEIGLDQKVEDLSGGQRSKVLLTKLLLQNPMILILDEPTNFLDEQHILWLKQFLQRYENAFILVSHDIPFLNEVVNVIYHVENARLTRYTGNYDDFLKMYELKKRQKEQAYEKQQKEIGQLEDFIARNKARVATSNMAKSRQKKLDKMEMIQLDREKPKPVFQFQEARTPGRFLIEVKGLIIGYDSPLTRPMDLVLERGQKVAIKGVNGLGKSTLLKTLLKRTPALAGHVDLDPFLHPGYFEQESLGGSRTALDEISEAFPALTQAEARAALAKCGLTNEHITSQVKVLSGGEAAKVRLCKVLNAPHNLLVLDEPTNHLDVEAKDALKKALIAFKGSILLVSHEPEFYEEWVSDVWNLEKWTTKIV